MVGRPVLIALSLAACGRIDFSPASDAHANGDGLSDAAPITIKIGARPGATPLGTRDTFLSPVSPDVAHGLEAGMQCDMPDVVLIDFSFPTGGPYPVLSAAVHGVANARRRRRARGDRVPRSPPAARHHVPSLSAPAADATAYLSPRVSHARMNSGRGGSSNDSTTQVSTKVLPSTAAAPTYCLASLSSPSTIRCATSVP